MYNLSYFNHLSLVEVKVKVYSLIKSKISYSKVACKHICVYMYVYICVHACVYDIDIQCGNSQCFFFISLQVFNRRKSLESQINELRKITGRVISYKENLQSLMQKNRQEFLSKYWDTQKDINELLNSEDFSLQRPVASPELSVYISDTFDSDLRNLGSVGGGPVVDLEAEMHIRGLLQLKWNLPDDSENVKEYEVEYETVLPLSVKQVGVTSVCCDGKALSYFVNAICPGHTYRFRIRSYSLSGWGMWSKSIIGRFDDFPRTIGFIAKIVTIKIPSTGLYRITAKGAKAADSERFKGGRGAIISATFLLQKGDLLEILCGGMSERQGCHSGGGGGTFVAVNNKQLENILLVAGGGGGTRGYDDQDCDGCDASLEPHGTSADTIHCAEGGVNGAPGKDANFLGPSWGHGGAGWQQSSTTAKSFVDGGNGGECGGFGGGGSVGLYGGGGGGGFSGGGGGRGGGGGGSYFRKDGENVTKEVGNCSHGEVEIIKVSGPPSLAHSRSTNSSNNSREHMKPGPTGTSPCNSFASGPTSISQQSSTDQVFEVESDVQTPNVVKQLSTTNLSSLGSNSEESHQLILGSNAMNVLSREPLQ